MLVIASDHGGLELKKELMDHLRDRGVDYEDIGTYSPESCDYPEYAARAARGVADGSYERGVLICGTGLGMALAANKVRGIRCALCSDCFTAEMSRAHNNANMLALGGRVLGAELAKRILDIFLDTEFQGGRHARRVEMLMELERT